MTPPKRREPVSAPPPRARAGASALFTDLYELTMAQAYFTEKLAGEAVFELFFRRMPEQRRYVVAAGLDDVLSFLETFRFEPDEIDYLRGLGIFGEEFLSALAAVRFTGDVWAVPEGTIVFENEPLVQIVAPILEAQLVETLVLNQVHFQSVIAAKASRVVDAAAGRAVVEFGARRAHGIDAAMKVARAAYLAGAAGTSNVDAARVYGMPPFGTMAHSFVQAYDDEAAAFEVFARLYPGTTLLVDTYDTLHGVDVVIALARELGPGFTVGGVRLDSGDLADLAPRARRRLDDAGLASVRIFASSELDEHAIAGLLARGAPIDAFGVGTRMAIASDAPALDMAYKLVAYEGVGRTKLSTTKEIYPGRKQVFRTREGGRLRADRVARFGDRLAGEPLLACVMEGGVRSRDADFSLQAARARLAEQRASLPTELRSLERREAPSPVEIDEALRRDLAALRARRGV